MRLTILNTREVKKITQLLKDTYGCAISKEYAYLRNEKNRLFVVTREVSQIDIDKIRIERMGLYFAEYKKTQIRLSKEGAQLLVSSCGIENVKHVVELDKKKAYAYFNGIDLKLNLDLEDSTVIVTYQKQVLGSARYKEGVLLNYVPKMYRGEVILS